MASFDLTLSDEDDDDFAPAPQQGACAAAAAAAAPPQRGQRVLLQPPGASARPGKTPALAQMNRAAVDRRLAEVRKELARLRREEAKLVARQEELELSDEARAEEQLRAANRVRKWDSPFDWDERVDRVLREHFRLEKFRPGQRAVVNAALSGQDVLVLMATGSGKSLCFQLPGMADERPGLTLVVSPLKSLMQDQCFELQKVGIAADFISAETPSSEATRILNEIDKPRSPHTRQFLYVTPERIAKSKRLLSKLEIAYRAKRIKRFVVDEVHCVAIDGNDFRPDYLKLAVLRTQFRDVPIIGCTATATQKVLEECASTLSLRGHCKFTGDFDRPNLFLRVMRKDASEKAHIASIAKVIRNQHAGETGIVYCLAKKECENFAEQLQGEGINAQPYHASMADDDRAYVHKAWRDGSVDVVCATIAFGMGINASGCRFVIHSTMSKGLDSYWQEAGRAGRDGALAACTVFAKGSDLTRISSMVADVPKKQARLEQLKRLYAAFRFVLQPPRECRRASLLRWFGQDPRAAIERCKKDERCDVCCPVVADDVAQEGCAVDVADGMRCLLQITERLERRGTAAKLTLIKLAETWRSNGAAHKSVRDGLDNEPPLPTAPYNKEDCERVAAIAICDGLLDERFVASSYSYTAYVQLGKKGADVLSGAADLPPTFVWLSKAAADKKKALAKNGRGDKKRKTSQCSCPETTDTAALASTSKNLPKRLTQTLGTSERSTAVASARAQSRLSLSSKATRSDRKQKTLAVTGRANRRQRPSVDVCAEFAQYDKIQEKVQSTRQSQQQQQQQQQQQEIDNDHDYDSIDEDCDAVWKREVAKIDAVYADTPHACSNSFAPESLDNAVTLAPPGARDAPLQNVSKAPSLRKKRRVPVPSDDEEEEAEDEVDPDAAAAQFQAEMHRAGGLSGSPEPPIDKHRNSNTDEAFDVGVESMFD